MKQNCKWIAALFTAASATLAFGCGFGGCGYTSYRAAPVGERVVYTQTYPGYYYNSPSPGQVLGNVITAPFRLVGGALSWTGQALSGQPGYLEPVGERYTTVHVIRQPAMIEPVGERVTIIRHRTILEPVGERWVSGGCNTCGLSSFNRCGYSSCNSCMPVGERFTTVRVIRHRMMEPVGERFITTRVIHHRTILQPVGEKFTTVKVFRHGEMLSPIGERYTKVIKHHRKTVMLRPVGERTIIRTHSVMLPVGERTWSTPSLGCGCR